MGLPEVPFRILDRMSQCVWTDEDLLELWGVDFRWIVPAWSQVEEIDENNYRNMWGTRFTNAGDYFAVAESPLRDKPAEYLADHRWPDPDEAGMFSGLREQAKRLHETTDYVIGADGIKGGVLQTALEMRGYDQFFMDLVLENEFAHDLLDRITDSYIRMYTRYMDEVGPYIQLVYLTDDFGTQNSLLMSPPMWEEFIKPREERIIRHIKKLADVKVVFHSDGSVLPLIDGIIESGVDILNPIQTSVEELRDTAALKARVGDRISFHGAVDVQNFLRTASPSEVRRQVAKLIRDLGTDGGYILCTCHNINRDIPPVNLKTMFASARDFGAYPLDRDLLDAVIAGKA
jgi:uroporphyrinogen decarboxylase